MVADTEELGGDGRIRTPCPKDHCKGSVIAHEWRTFYIPNRRWNGKTLWRRSGSENIQEEKNKIIFEENQTGLLLNPTTRLIMV